MKKSLLLFSVCILVLFTGCFGAKKSSVKGVENIKTEINKTEGVEVSSYYSANNEVIFEIKNKSDNVIDYINIDIAFYSQDGKLLKVEKQYVRNIMKDATNFVKIGLSQNDEQGNIVLPKKIEVTLNKTTYSSKFETIYTDKVSGEVTKTENDGELSLSIKNDSGEVLDDVAAAVVFYKDSKPVDVQLFNFQNVNATASQSLYVSTIVSDEKVETLNYDEAKVIINNASKYITQ